MGISLYVILLCWDFVTEYCKRFYRISPFPKLLLFHLFCIYWDWQGQKCKLEFSNVYEINYIVTVISACTHPCGIQTPLPTTSQEYVYWNWKSIISEWGFFFLKKIIFRHKISILKSYIIFNETVCYMIIAFF